MTPEQEQLVLKIVSQLADARLIVRDPYQQTSYHCLFCKGRTSLYKYDFEHTPDCPVLLARQLRKTLPTTAD